MIQIRVQRWRDRDRFLSAVLAVLLNGIIGYALLMGLATRPLPRDTDEMALITFDLSLPMEPSPDTVQPVKSPPTKREGGGRAAPARSPASDHLKVPHPPRDVAPAPIIALPVLPLPAVAPPTGADGNSGTAGAGGIGGGSGTGTGSGMGRGRGKSGGFSGARQIRGRFRNSDFPQTAHGAGPLKIGVRYAVVPSGRVENCEIIETSGYADVDAMTCRVIQERYRFRPARDPEGYAVTEVREEDYRWRAR